MKAFLFIGIALLIPSLCFSSLTATDNLASLEELHQLLEKENDGPTKFNLLNKLANKYSVISIEKAYAFNSQAYELGRQLDDPMLMAASLFTLAKIQEADFTSSDKILYNYQLALSLYPENAIKERIQILNKIGYVYRKSGNYKKAVQYFTHALDMVSADTKQWMAERLQSTIQISITSFFAKEYDKALEYIVEARKIFQAFPHLKSDFVAFQLSLLSGNIYLAQGRIEEARTFFSLALIKDLNKIHPELVGRLFISIGDVSNSEKDFAQAEKFYQKSYHIGLESKNGYTQIKALKSLAKLSFERKDFDKCLQYCFQAINHTYSSAEKLDLLDFYSLLYQVYEKTNQHQKALGYHKKLKHLSDSLRLEKNTIEFNIYESELKVKEQQAKIDLLNLDQRTHQSKITFLSILSIFGMGLILAIFYFLLKYKDVNHALEEKYKEIEAAKNEALQASKTKQDFLSVMSHEIRTPMNAVLGLTNILKDESPREDQLVHLNYLQFSAKNLLFIINNILDFSKIESGKLELVKEQFKLQNLLDNIVNSLRYSRKKRDLTIKQNQELSTLNSIIVGDPIRLNQILVNLIGNAIKFTNKGHVILHSKVLTLDRKKTTIQFDIEDTGIGIPQDKINSIFDSFTQVTQTHDRQYEGSGLGLAITKKLVDLHEGEISVKSVKGKGSTFTLILSFNLGDAEGANQDSDTTKSIFQTGIEGKRILLVEDNKINQLVAKKILNKFKTIISIAENGVECINKLTQDDFDLILMDIHMPIMDGIEATHKIRAMEGLKQHIPIIGLSADAYSEAVENAKAAGMNDYLSKPFKPKDLYDAILKATLTSRHKRLEPRRSRG